MIAKQIITKFRKYFCASNTWIISYQSKHKIVVALTETKPSKSCQHSKFTRNTFNSIGTWCCWKINHDSKANNNKIEKLFLMNPFLESLAINQNWKTSLHSPRSSQVRLVNIPISLGILFTALLSDIVEKSIMTEEPKITQVRKYFWWIKYLNHWLSIKT